MGIKEIRSHIGLTTAIIVSGFISTLFAWSWGRIGHHVASMMAEERLSPHAVGDRDMLFLLSVLLFQRNGNNLFIISRDDAAVGVCRMGPVHRAQFAAVPRIASGLDELGAADFPITLRGELRDDQFAPIVIDEVAVALAYDEA